LERFIVDALREVIRVLMQQIREEERLREECLQNRTIRDKIPEVTDGQVESRIQEIKEVLKIE
jgi:hypothetical protein